MSTEHSEPLPWDDATDVCEDCWGESVPLDDCFNCPTCDSRGWIYVEMRNAPHLSHADVEIELKRQREAGANKEASNAGN